MKTEAQFPLPVRLSTSQCSFLETSADEAMKTHPEFTKTQQLETMIKDFVARMETTPKFHQAMANHQTVREVEAALAPLLELLEVAQKNDWPLHTVKRSPSSDIQHLENMHGRIPFLKGEVAKAHALIDATKRTQRWLASHDITELVAAVNAIASGAAISDTSAIKVFAAGIGLDVKLLKPASWSKPAPFVLQRSYNLSSEARANITAIISEYDLNSESAAIRLVLDYYGKTLPTILKPKLSPPPHDEVLDFIKDWTRNAGIALRNGRTPAVHVEIYLTAIFDLTLKDLLAVAFKTKSVVLQSTTLAPHDLVALQSLCDDHHSPGGLVSLLGFFKKIGVFCGNPTDVLKPEPAPVLKA